jgi:hypothetical protein
MRAKSSTRDRAVGHLRTPFVRAHLSFNYCGAIPSGQGPPQL